MRIYFIIFFCLLHRINFLLVFIVEFPPNVRIVLLDKMADVEYRLSAGCSEKLQLGSLVAAFDTAKHLVAKEVS